MHLWGSPELAVQQPGCLEVMAAAVLGPWVQGISAASGILAPLQHARYIKDPKTREQVFPGSHAVRKFGLVFSATLWMLKHSHWMSAVFSDEKMFCWNYQLFSHQPEKQKERRMCLDNEEENYKKYAHSFSYFFYLWLRLISSLCPANLKH